ncbi:hypothetical protein, partial [Micromonospora arborensis]|uniref:hypothetical protein n=1 Tax=Micromonospora arborensis TaxID=2116518 RepID=UPI001ABFB217
MPRGRPLGADPSLLLARGNHPPPGVLDLPGGLGPAPLGCGALPLVPGVRPGALPAHPRGQVGKPPQLR